MNYKDEDIDLIKEAFNYDCDAEQIAEDGIELLKLLALAKKNKGKAFIKYKDSLEEIIINGRER